MGGATMTITYADLPQLVTRDGWKGPRPFLCCLECGAHFSANADDYWDVADDHVFTHCDKPMNLATEKTTLEPWEKGDDLK